MMKTFTAFLRFVAAISGVVLGIIIVPHGAIAWTSARIANVDVTLRVSSGGDSTFVTQARFEVVGGKFHGFDLAPVKDGNLVEAECKAVHDDGQVYGLKFKQLFDGRTRIVLADKAYVKSGGVTFSLVHTTNLEQTGALRGYAGRARLDWTPIVWDEGTDRMTLRVELPGQSKDAPVVADPTVVADYEAEFRPDGVTFTKYRTVRWYPMQVILDFDPAVVSMGGMELVPGEAPGEETPAPAALSPVMEGPAVPWTIAVIPCLVFLLGLALLFYKAIRVRRAIADLGITPRFGLLPNTGMGFRVVLSIATGGLGLTAAYLGSVSASVLPVAVATSLWIMRRERSSLHPRPGGNWRKMAARDLERYKLLAREYAARRRTCLDISTSAGLVSFAFITVATTLGAWYLAPEWPKISWSIVVYGLLMYVPAWFSSPRSELPVDPTLEGFTTLRKWRPHLTRLVGTINADTDASFWVREDDKGTIEVRLRVEPPPAGLVGLEIAGEVVRAGLSHRTRKATILRMEPGTAAARKIAACPHAAEHHLTADLEEEVVVLRDRRGSRDTGLSPLRVALERLEA